MLRFFGAATPILMLLFDAVSGRLSRALDEREGLLVRLLVAPSSLMEVED